MPDTPRRGWSKAARRRTAARHPKPDAARCDNCQAGPAVYARTDAAGLRGTVCHDCQWLTRDELSFG